MSVVLLLEDQQWWVDCHTLWKWKTRENTQATILVIQFFSLASRAVPQLWGTVGGHKRRKSEPQHGIYQRKHLSRVGSNSELSSSSTPFYCGFHFTSGQFMAFRSSPLKGDTICLGAIFCSDDWLWVHLEIVQLERSICRWKALLEFK